jgi:Flp pilus assembly protein TadD
MSACEVCGALSAPSDRFCGGCGATISRKREVSAAGEAANTRGHRPRVEAAVRTRRVPLFFWLVVIGTAIATIVGVGLVSRRDALASRDARLLTEQIQQATQQHEQASERIKAGDYTGALEACDVALGFSDAALGTTKGPVLFLRGIALGMTGDLEGAEEAFFSAFSFLGSTQTAFAVEYDLSLSSPLGAAAQRFHHAEISYLNNAASFLSAAAFYGTTYQRSVKFTSDVPVLDSDNSRARLDSLAQGARGFRGSIEEEFAKFSATTEPRSMSDISSNIHSVWRSQEQALRKLERGFTTLQLADFGSDQNEHISAIKAELVLRDELNAEVERRRAEHSTSIAKLNARGGGSAQVVSALDSAEVPTSTAYFRDEPLSSATNPPVLERTSIARSTSSPHNSVAGSAETQARSQKRRTLSLPTQLPLVDFSKKLNSRHAELKRRVLDGDFRDANALRSFERDLEAIRTKGRAAGFAWIHVAERFPDDPVPEYNSAASSINTMDDWSAASHFEEAVRIDPQFAPAHFAMGVTFARDGHWGKAASSFRRSLAISPDLPGARELLGLAESKVAELSAE